MASVARYCCCEATCGSLEVTISGINGNSCCVPQGAGNSVDLTGLTVDGVYTLAFRLNAFPTCNYEANCGSGTLRQFSGTTCGTLVKPTYSSHGYKVFVNTSNNLITSVGILDVTQTALGGTLFSAVGSWAFGDTINNQLACSTNYTTDKSLCNVGSVVVDRP